jgi:UDP-GlcNAc:undecaprenyl-phosphate GlcNAc-1-phosphate transferase
LAMSIQDMALPVIFASASAVILLMSATLLPRIHSNS